ncbi:MAG: peptidoglycan D,D-transpeptidase FtsI family protein [Candidatus Dormibacteria bacterium]
MADRRQNHSTPTRPRRPADLAQRGPGAHRTPAPGPRLIALALLLLVAVVGLAARLVDIQLGQGPQLAAAAISNQVQSVSIPATRGLILDDSGQVLAGNAAAYDIFADPKQIPASQRLREADLLAAVLHLSAAHLATLLAKPLEFVYLARTQPPAVESRLRHLNLQGIGSLRREVRSYGPGAVPGTSLASDLLGFVNQNGQGQYGLEGYYNRQLAGHAGRESVVSDLQGDPVVLGDQPTTKAVNGRNLQTSLDATVQWAVEQDLAQEVKKVNGASGTMMVMNAHTGAIVAWADYPSYNANDYASEPVSLFRDQGVADLYEPGSVMKVVTFAGALQRGTITPDATFDETAAAATVQGVTIQDWDHRYHGVITYNWVLEDSLNAGAVHVEELEGGRPFYDNMENFGIGQPTGIDLAGEASQRLPQLSSLQPLQLATASFGQGVVATPVEVMAAINAVANGGVWVQPHVVTSISGGGQPTTYVQPRTRRVISTQTAATLAQMMVGVVDVTGASGYEARIWPTWKGEIAGKTGTASVAQDGVYGANTIDSFAEFLPASDPQYTLFCIIRAPQVPAAQREGAYDAAPTTRAVSQVLINRFKLQP